MNSKKSLPTDSLPRDSSDKILVRGVHCTVTPEMMAVATKNGAHLLRHHDRIIRVRFDLEFDHTKHGQEQYVAHGRVEVSGPDLIASVASEDMSKSIDLLADKLDRMLRERARTRKDRRNNRPEGEEFRDQLAEP